jgi:nitroreductase
MSRLQQFVAELHVPFDHDVAIRFFKADPSKRLYGTSITPPPDHAAFMAHTDMVSISKAGFVGELLILYATSLGLATCWYGHYSFDELQRLMPHLGRNAATRQPRWGYGKGEVADERAICITPLGYWRKDGLRLIDRMTGAIMSYKRKPVGELLAGGLCRKALSPDVAYALDLARKAPSAANSQFWRFTVAPDLKTVSVSMPVGYRHFKWEHPNVDIGICACHLWLGLRLKGLETAVHLTEEDGRAMWTFAL